MRRRRNPDRLDDTDLVRLFESLLGRDRHRLHAVLAHYGSDAVEAIQARRRLRGAYVRPASWPDEINRRPLNGDDDTDRGRNVG